MAMHHPSVPLAEAKNKLSELIDRVSRGEEIVISRHNTDIARLVPIGRPPRRDISEAIAKMRATRKDRRASVEEILQWRSEGRR
jgi:prevent-host-death family protein